MPQQLGDLIKDLKPDDIRVDNEGRILITSPAVSEKIKAIGTRTPDEILASDDTNVICCGNGTCSKKGELGRDLGSLVERFTKGGVK